MNITYCASCGKRIEYKTTKPEDCPSCNKSLGSVFKAAESTASVAKPTKKKNQRIQYNDDEYEDDGFEIVMPDASDVQVGQFKKFTVASLKNGEAPPALPPSSDLPSDTEVASRSYFHKQD